MSGALRFTELRVRRMPGFEERGFDLEGLAPGVVLVHGPNASGKTTAATALQRLLWPTSGGGTGTGSGRGRAWVSGRFTLDGDDWHVEVDGDRVVWQRDGEPAAPPALPAGSAAPRYFLSLTELLRSEDEELADLIRRESAGGHDVAAAAEELGLSPGGRPATLVRALDDARQRLDDARSAADRLREDQRRLDDLRARRAELREKAALALALERALELARARHAVTEAKQALASFADEIARLEGDEVRRLEEWDERERELRDALAAAEAGAAAAEAEREAAGLGEDGVGSAVLTALERKLEALRRDQAEVETALAERDEARARRERAGAELGIDASDDDPLPALAPEDARRVDAFIDRAQRVREKRAALEAWIGVLSEGDGGRLMGDGDPDPDPGPDSGGAGDLPGVVRLLRQWLRAGTGETERRGARLLLVSVAVLFLIAAGLGVAGFLWPAAGPALFSFAAVAGLAAVALLALRPSRASDPRAPIQAELERLGQAPGEWTVDRVHDQLDALEREAAARAVAEERRAERTRRVRERDGLEREAQALEKEREALARSLGIDLPVDDLTLALTATRLRQWDAARGDEAAAARRLDSARHRFDDALAGARELVQPFGYDPDDGDAVAGALAELRERRERHGKAVASLDQARRDRARAEGELDRLADGRAALLERVGVPGEAVVRELMAEREAWKAADDALALTRRERDAAEAGLLEIVERQGRGEPEPGRVAELMSAAREELEGRLAEARQADADEREVASEIAGIEARLDDARQRHDVEDALAAVATARADLAAQRDRDIDDAIGQALVGWLEDRASEANRPAVFHRARSLLATITRGQFLLELGDDGDFRARDTVAGRVRALDQLSAGTRIQLLLAVRVAFIETQEQGAAPPLLLDEVLANADDVRARAIIDAALALARDGRQVFYFTAQADELAKWREALDDAGDVEWARCALADADPDAAAWEEGVGREPAGAPDPVPAPDGRSHADYGTLLDVPAWDPWAPVGTLHLWYLLDDPDALHGLLQLGIDRWGKLQGFARHAPDADAVRPVLETVRRAARLCERCGELWRQGRGRPVDRAALEASGAITDTFIDRVADLCGTLDGDAGALLDALEHGEVARFRSSSIEELRRWLVDHGHLATDARLSDDEIRLRLVAGIAEEEGAEAADAEVRRIVARLRAGAHGALGVAG